ncbi:NRDE family protein [Guptibacillus algicola]|uniref:NRDE family protein n=1 Tax=Guptibacillus algicola TaxID=225844 RepID=UPI001CD73ACA|nr:NRDE family protein [Alkalihalobacillus algicola]MCA0988224.1 NRDE family protein [Alkalihalobacillus algicola]
MCLIAVAIEQNPKYPFILIANRDEFYERPTETAHFWNDHPNLLAGRDLKAYGTWLGVTVEGKIAALTNFREPTETHKEKSRGELPVNFLTRNVHAYDYMISLQSVKDSYNGFNLFAGHFNELYYYSNRENEVRKVPEGIHAVSNHLLNTSWPKVDLLKEYFSNYLCENVEPDPEKLLTLLDHAEPALDRDLPDTGIPLEWERMLSSIYINSDTYGTRAQTVVIVSNDGEVTFMEKANEKINKFQFFIDPS